MLTAFGKGTDFAEEAMDRVTLRRVDGFIWAIICTIAVAVFAVSAFGNFQIAFRTFVVPTLACAALLLGAEFYERRRKDVRLATALGGTAQIIAFAAIGAPLSYLAASVGLPLHDDLFDAVDKMLGLDWRGLLGWMNAHPLLHPLFLAAYLSLTPQATTTVLALAFTGHLLRLRTFILAFILAALITIAVSALLPAEGVWGHYELGTSEYPAITPATREQHLAVFHGLREGTFRMLMGSGSEGIITFPSLHAALGVIFILALWPVPLLRWVGVVGNLLLIVATPVDGGHYFVDVLAGVVIALACWLASQATIGAAIDRKRAFAPRADTELATRK